MPLEQKIFVVYVGGKTSGSNIELHDIRFCIGQTIKDCYEDLREQWWGTPESLHLDCWGALESADGYDIGLHSEPGDLKNKLYFVNLGGYDSNQFTELHQNVYVVTDSEASAKLKAVKMVKNWESPHKDYLYEVENMVCLSKIAERKRLYLHLIKTSHPKEFKFVCKYTSIGKPAFT